MTYSKDGRQETLQDRLAALDQRIARMRAMNASSGDMLALRLVEHAETERRQILALMPDRSGER